ncbi:CorA family divalent cation transporter [Pontibacter saemangeumensis]|uniref:CorA family divalent cation transporter n=1 Tax=Pontibacter saemangeumensis TaxID=1084525 RepID=UPI0031EF8737
MPQQQILQHLRLAVRRHLLPLYGLLQVHPHAFTPSPRLQRCRIFLPVLLAAFYVEALINNSLSLSSQKTNEVMRVLTVFSAFFLPRTFIVGVYGMNFNFMPELGKTRGYPAVLAVIGMVTLAIYLSFRRKGWLS